MASMSDITDIQSMAEEIKKKKSNYFPWHIWRKIYDFCFLHRWNVSCRAIVYYTAVPSAKGHKGESKIPECYDYLFFLIIDSFESFET